MTTKPVPSPNAQPSNLGAGIVARIGQVAIGFGLEAAILFIASGRLDWLWSWVFLAIYVVAVLINSVFLFRTSPETIAERGHGYVQMKGWDRLISGLWGLSQFILLPLIAGLDVRFGWSNMFSMNWHIVGAVVFTIGMALFGWAMITNAYFSTVVRIQSERGHTVCRTGPYRFVRHPGYLGANLQSLGIPLLLGSIWAFVPGLIALVAMVIRTSMEDHTLCTELPGYADYTHDVRYRLIPGIW